MKDNIIINDEYRMKVINFLKIYGYYNGVLVSRDIEKNYINGLISVNEVIKDKKDFKKLKRSINKVLDYCYETGFNAIEKVINYFYKVECCDLRKQYGGFFDKF